MTEFTVQLPEDEDEPTKEEFLADFRQGTLDALAGRTRPADAVIEELRRKYQRDKNLYAAVAGTGSPS